MEGWPGNAKNGYRILIVDDDATSANVAKHILEEAGFLCHTELSGVEGIEFAKLHPPHLILLDKRMPGMDGFETLAVLRESSQTSWIPVVFLTSDVDAENEIRCFKEGASDFITKPIVPEIMIHRIRRIIDLNRMLHEMDDLVDERTRELKAQEQSRRNLSDQIIVALASAVDAKDEYTNGHSHRVAEYALELAKLLGKDEEYQEEIYYMGMLHDIGKIGIPDDIIHKTTTLTDEEYDQIKQHPVIGANILENIREMPNLAVGAHYHHERYDGNGYPEGLKGEEIPEPARIIAVADSYDAMTSTRTYHDVKPQEFARGEIEKGMGTQFDPVIAKKMLELIDKDVDFHMRDGKKG